MSKAKGMHALKIMSIFSSFATAILINMYSSMSLPTDEL